ncbi:hypothetical protein BK126_14990 [Paenibacillus sp. FSL H7-0326]|uniref:hypothetical protein n=1 Tax=Paenibacillus sp. FSL H7-0326 TaxID=1921144 RepID=UPI00096BD5A8|nr:hypothetical protein [Paenibacillus sp. FSL H7-0326]OMC69079.1 hypothetical protein BK126_14990 [Paenibacillus sp. FSL H7-0326]
MEHALFEILTNIFLDVKDNDFRESDDYKIKHGGNAIIVFPQSLELQPYCLRTPITKTYKERLIDETGDKSRKQHYRETLNVDTPLDDQMIGYQQISKNQKLKNHIPVFYSDEQNTLPFIVTENIQGTQIKLEMLLPNCQQVNLSPIESVYCLFKQEGFEFGDKVEGIWDGNKIVLVDLAEIRQLI